MNGIAVDTTSVPSDAVLDVKIFSNGYYAYQVDETGLFDSDEPMFGGLVALDHLSTMKKKICYGIPRMGFGMTN